MFLKYSAKGASTRYRSLNYLSDLEKIGVEYEVNNLFCDEYLLALYSNQRVPIFYYIKRFLLRVRAIIWVLRRYNYSYIEYELFPFFPPVFEFLFQLRGIKVIYDYDDATFLRYETGLKKIVLSRKFESLCKTSCLMLCGNPHLESAAKTRGARNTILLPTAVDSERYKKSELKNKDGQLRVCWIGSPATVHYLVNIAPVLNGLIETNVIRLMVIGVASWQAEGLKANQFVEWSSESETDYLVNNDVGIMPLENDSWSRGKCGFKILQYMASGLAVIASPVGVNVQLIEKGGCGYLAGSAFEYRWLLQRLAGNRDLLWQMGEMGRNYVNQKYSREINAKFFCASIKSVEREVS